MDASDSEVIQQCLDGDAFAFEILVGRYKKLIYTSAYRMMGNKEEAEDVSQEAFIRIYGSLARYNSEFKFSTWAMKITSNLCLDHLRKRKNVALPMENLPEITDDDKTPEECYISDETGREVQAAIDKLPAKYKEFLVLFHVQNLSYQEIMDLTGESLTIVKNRLYRARQMLKEIMIENKGGHQNEM